MKTPEQRRAYNREWMRNWYRKNKELARKQKREDYKRHQEKRLRASRQWALDNPEKAAKRKRAHYENNREQYLSRADKYQKRARLSPQRRLRDSLSARIWNALAGKVKSERTLGLLGCSVEQLKEHLERQFKPGMTWDNYGYYGWHIDHVIPCASFNLSDPKQQKVCFNWQNLQPLWQKENFTKGKKCP